MNGKNQSEMEIFQMARSFATTQDVDIFDRFHYAIPVVQIGRSELRAPITDAELASALASASSFPGVEIVS